MPTGARKKRAPDVLRMGMAMSYPGIDPRSWVGTARVDFDPVAISWDPVLGLLVDVSSYSGTMSETEVPCRVLSPAPGHYYPPRGELLLALPGGSAEEGPIAVGALTNIEDLPPQTINGLPVVMGGAPGAVDPLNTEMVSTELNRCEEYGGSVERYASGPHGIWSATEVTLGSREAAEPFIKGATHAANLNTLLTAIGVYASAIKTIADPSGAATTALLTAITTFTSGLVPGGDLSLKIRGE